MTIDLTKKASEELKKFLESKDALGGSFRIYISGMG